MQSLWKGESAIFAGCNQARLLVPARSIERVYNAVTGEEFDIGRDYVWQEGSDTIGRTESSRITFLSDAELHPENAVYYPDPNANAVPNGGKNNIRFDAKLFFAEHQFEIDYTPLDSELPSAFHRPERVPHFRRMVSLGDSITEGYNASAFIGRAPFRKQYARLVADAVGAELFNLGVNGVPSAYWREVREQAVGFAPDLITIAYGMNDLSELTAAQYVAEIAQATEYFHKACPHARIVLVSAMSGNPEWNCTPAAKSQAFADALRKYARKNGFTFADVYSVWSYAVSKKGFFALTGNGVNHPNDYGHRLYAMTILNSF